MPFSIFKKIMKSLKLSISYFALLAICLLALVGVAKADDSVDLSITKTINNSNSFTARQGEIVEIELTCANNGPSTATSITVSDNYSNRYKIKNVSNLPDECEDTGKTVECKIDEIASGDDLTLTYSAEVSITASSGNSENFANISSPLNDINIDNNSDSAILRVIQSRAVNLRIVDNVQLSLTKMAVGTSGQWEEGDTAETAIAISSDDTQEVVYQTLVYNDGSQTAYNVEISDVFAGKNVEMTKINDISGATWDSKKDVFVIERIEAKEIVAIVYSATLQRTGKGKMEAVNVATVENAEYKKGLMTDPARVNIEGIGSTDPAFVVGEAKKDEEPKKVVTTKAPTTKVEVKNNAVLVETDDVIVRADDNRVSVSAETVRVNTATETPDELPETGSNMLLILIASLLAGFGIRKFATRKA